MGKPAVVPSVICPGCLKPMRLTALEAFDQIEYKPLRSIATNAGRILYATSVV